jgi:outer membrane protein assembly factor BamB
LWESKIEPLAAALEGFRQESIKAGQFGNRPSMPRVSALSFSEKDDVLITTDFQTARDFTHGNLGLMAFDGKTGEEFWRIPGAIGLWATPVRWVYQGKEYIIAGNTLGQLRCIEPRSGKDVWKIDGVGQFWVEPTVIDDYLLAPVGGLEWSGGYAPHGSYAKESGCRLGCYRISDQGAKQLWVLPKGIQFPGNDTLAGRDGYAFSRLNGKHVCIDLKTGKFVSTEPRDPLAPSANLKPKQSRAGINELWEDRWVYAPNFTHDRADGTHGMLEARKHHMFLADPKNLSFMNAYLLPHKRFSSYDCKGLTWPYVDGRIFLRGGDGVYCYDLRKKDPGVR